MKRMFIFAISLIVLTGLFSHTAFASFWVDLSWIEKKQNSIGIGDFKCYEESGEIIIMGYSGSEEKLIIPETINEKKVTAIGHGAFNSCISLESVIIPDSVAIIDDHAFSECTNLKSIDIQNSVTSIGEYAFCNCTSLRNIHIPENVTRIGFRAFCYCTSLESVFIPKSVTDLDKNIFENCSDDLRLLIESKSSALQYAIDNNYKYQIVESGDVGDQNDESIQSENEQIDYKRDDDSFRYLSTYKNCIEIYRYYGIERSLEVPEEYQGKTVVKIDEMAFKDCTTLREIKIPESVNTIGNEAFNQCICLKRINIPHNVTWIGNMTFNQCVSLENINIPESVTSIGDGAFNDCTSLREIKIPESVTSIGEMAFGSCSSLENVNIPENVTSIEWQTFMHCSNLKKIYIPESVTIIGKGAFSGCTRLESINIPENVTIIGEEAFAYCSSLESINIPENVTLIKEKAFSNCSSLKSIILPDNIRTIYHDTFGDCTSLESVYIPKSVTDIHYDAFDNCSEDLVLSVEDGSYALQYAIDNNYKYKIVESSDVEDQNNESIQSETDQIEENSGYTDQYPTENQENIAAQSELTGYSLAYVQKLDELFGDSGIEQSELSAGYVAFTDITGDGQMEMIVDRNRGKQRGLDLHIYTYDEEIKEILSYFIDCQPGNYFINLLDNSFLLIHTGTFNQKYSVIYKYENGIFTEDARGMYQGWIGADGGIIEGEYSINGTATDELTYTSKFSIDSGRKLLTGIPYADDVGSMGYYEAIEYLKVMSDEDSQNIRDGQMISFPASQDDLELISVFLHDYHHVNFEGESNIYYDFDNENDQLRILDKLTKITMGSANNRILSENEYAGRMLYNNIFFDTSLYPDWAPEGKKQTDYHKEFVFPEKLVWMIAHKVFNVEESVFELFKQNMSHYWADQSRTDNTERYFNGYFFFPIEAQEGAVGSLDIQILDSEQSYKLYTVKYILNAFHSYYDMEYTDHETLTAEIGIDEYNGQKYCTLYRIYSDTNSYENPESVDYQSNNLSGSDETAEYIWGMDTYVDPRKNSANINSGEVSPNSIYEESSPMMVVNVFNTGQEGLALKENPDINSTRYIMIPDGTRLEIQEVRNGWGYTSYAGYSGWIYLQYAKTITGMQAQMPTYGSVIPYYQAVFDTGTEGLELRTGPDSSNPSFGPVPDGYTVLVEAVENNWAYTSYNGNYGWVHTRYLHDSTDIVFQVQQALNTAGYNCGVPDGNAGPATHAAMKSYQSARGLQVTERITKELVDSLGIN